MRKIIGVLTILLAAVVSLPGSALAKRPDFSQMTPEQIQAYQAYQAYHHQQMLELQRSVEGLGEVGTAMQENARQAQQTNAQIFRSTVSANREWTQHNAAGVIFHCIQVGYIISCK